MPTPKSTEDKPSEVARTKRATFDRLAKKTRVEKEVTLTLTADDGTEEEVTILFRAIGAKAYDDLMAKHPPLAKQKMDGAIYNVDTFAPALIAACAIDPDLKYEEAKALWDSEEWSRGEVMTLFSATVELNNKGLNIPFIGNG